MKTIVVIQYKPLEFLPPVMALLLTLKDMGLNVVYVGVPSDPGSFFLDKNQICNCLMPHYNRNLYKNPTLITKVTHRIQRLLAFYKRRKWVKEILLQLEKDYGEYVLWYSEVLSAALVGNWGERFKKRVLSIYELADFNGRYWQGFSFNKLLHNVRIVVPEYNRAHILKEYFRLKDLPFVIPNKPALHPRQKNLPISNSRIKTVLDKINNRPIFLYQGVWTPDRKDVAYILETIAKARPNYCVLTMPECSAVKDLAKKYPNVFYVPYVSPPNHLELTSHATVGIAIYNASGNSHMERLNAVYCAPNKIFEYAGFGIPTLGNNLPGLKYTIGLAKAGVCCEMNENSILKCADELIQNISFYSKNAKDYYDDVDIGKGVAAILNMWE